MWNGTPRSSISPTPYPGGGWSGRRRVRAADALLVALDDDGVLRKVLDDAFFEHQREPEANRMAAFPARDREAFDARWRRLLATTR